MKRFLVFISLCLPLVGVLFMALSDMLGPDPGEQLIIYFAHIGISMLLATVSLRALSRVALFSGAKRYSRMLGLFTFFYVALHFLSYLAFEAGFSFDRLKEDLLERPYAYLGMISFIVILLMAATSFRVAQRKLGPRWKKLHMLVYPATAIAIIHIIWVARSDLVWAVLYGSIFCIIVFCRFFIQPKKLS